MTGPMRDRGAGRDASERRRLRRRRLKPVSFIRAPSPELALLRYAAARDRALLSRAGEASAQLPRVAHLVDGDDLLTGLAELLGKRSRDYVAAAKSLPISASGQYRGW
jgi:hypothetical protein